jgi:hypothetical protein
MVNSSTLELTTRRWWQRSRRRLGIPGLVGAALLTLAIGLGAAWPTFQHSADDTRSVLEHRRELLGRPQVSLAVPMSPQEQADRFAEGLPSFEQNAADVQKVFAGAERAHVALTKGDYALKADAGSPFITYTATFPVHESYGALKAFAADVLQSLPHAALEELRMARSDASGAVLDATVRFTFIYRRP